MGVSFSEMGYFRGAEFGKENQGSCRAKLHLKQPFQIVQEAVGGGAHRVVSGWSVLFEAWAGEKGGPWTGLGLSWWLSGGPCPLVPTVPPAEPSCQCGGAGSRVPSRSCQLLL